MAGRKNNAVMVNLYFVGKKGVVSYKLTQKEENAYADNGFFVLRMKDKDGKPKVVMYPSTSIEKVVMNAIMIEEKEEEPVVVSPEEAEAYAYTE